MNKIINSLKHNIYASDVMVGKYIYYKSKSSDANLYYIFNIESVIPINETEIKYKLKRCFLMYVPVDENRTSFLYDNYKDITIYASSELYELTFAEYVNTFRVFLQNDGKVVKELPDKLIQDTVL